MMEECKDCPYYDPEDDVCMACECWPVVDCDEPLPCEIKEGIS